MDITVGDLGPHSSVVKLELSGHSQKHKIGQIRGRDDSGGRVKQAFLVSTMGSEFFVRIKTAELGFEDKVIFFPSTELADFRNGTE